MIELQGISKNYRDGTGTLSVLEDVNLHIEAGEFVSLLGPSGSGKSTLLHILGLLDRPTTGSYRLQGQEISRLGAGKMAALRNQYIGFVFQQFMLMPRLTVRENVELPLLYRNCSRRERSVRVKQALEQVGLSHKIRALPTALSGGQKQRVAIARAIVTEPSLLLADEPTGNLDAVSKQEVMQVIEGLHQTGKTIVLVTHDEEMAHRTERILCMSGKRLIPYETASKEGER